MPVSASKYLPLLNVLLYHVYFSQSSDLLVTINSDGGILFDEYFDAIFTVNDSSEYYMFCIILKTAWFVICQQLLYHYTYTARMRTFDLRTSITIDLDYVCILYIVTSTHTTGI